jgi:hypothetical protein
MAVWLAQAEYTGATIGLAVALVVSWCVFYLLMRRRVNRTSQNLRQEFEERLNQAMIGARLAQSGTSAARPGVSEVHSAPVPAQPEKISAEKATQAGEAASAAGDTPPLTTAPPVAAGEEVSPETLLVIAAAVTAYLGKKVRIRSAKVVYSPDSFNAWSQQGRVFVQASHNLAQRGH